ncbi:MAG: hypothetical protein QNJ36_08765 [Calothrix sp. MO_167.B42]|nr:hypothetical protein [Calothrix sp. MO_167.B42]
MFINRLHRLLITPNEKSSRWQMIFWFSLSIAVSIIYAMLALQKAFSAEYVVQDDARQHVFWMVRFIDADLFPNDLIADYFQSVAPLGYSSLYRFMANLGVNPLLFNKILPSILGLLTTVYCFGACLQILPIPITGFIATVMLNQNLWMKDDLSSGTARGFVYFLFLAFLYYLLRKSLLPCLATIVLLGIFYPQCVFISVGILILRILDWQARKFRLSRQRHHYVFCVVGTGVAFSVMLIYALRSSDFAPVITVAQAKKLPELLSGGRSAFFFDNPFIHYLGDTRGGIFSPWLFSPITLCFAFFLPWLWRFRAKFPLLGQLTEEIVILPQILITSLGMFSAAHILLFRLYLPSRYIGYSFRVVLTLSAAIALTTILDTVLSNSFFRGKIYPLPRKLFALSFTALLTISLLFYYPVFIKKFPKPAYRIGNYGQLYEFLKTQPKDTLIASIDPEVDNLPSFTQRSILAGREYAIPWHFGYYRKFRQRTIDLIQAEYSPDLADVNNLMQKYGVDFWLLKNDTFTIDYVKKNKWLKQYLVSKLKEDELVKLTNNIVQDLQRGTVPALSQMIPNCTAIGVQNYVVLDAKCIANTKKNS